MKIIVSILLLVSLSLFAQPNPENGKKIFTTRCAACHNLKQKLVGPSLKDLHKRRKEDWIIKFVQNSQALVSAGDPEAVAIFNEFNQTVMPPHVDLTPENVKEVIAYIQTESEKMAEANKATNATPTAGQNAEGGNASGGSSYTFVPSFFYVLFGFGVVVMLIGFNFFVDINSKSPRS